MYTKMAWLLLSSTRSQSTTVITTREISFQQQCKTVNEG